MSPRFWRGLRRQGAVVAILGFSLWWIWRPGAPAPADDDPRLTTAEWTALGGRMAVSIYRTDGRSPADAMAEIEALRQFTLAYESRWAAQGPERPEFELAAINRALAAGRETEIPVEMRPLFASAARYGSLSGGLFDVRIGRLLQLWGFTGPGAPTGLLPDPAQLAAAVAGIQRPSVGGAQAPQLDFGPLARGDAADQLLTRLRSAGFMDVLVEVGPVRRAGGLRGGQAWTPGLQLALLPAGGPSHTVGTVRLQDGDALATRSVAERHFERDGRHYHDVLDPRHGAPAEGLLSATVIAADGVLAAAASTALLVAGPAQWRDTARALGIDRALVVDTTGAIHASEGLLERLSPAAGASLQRVP